MALNPMPKTSDVAARIAERLGVAVADPSATIYVSDCYDPNYLNLFGKKWPAVWVAAKRFTPTDDGRGVTGLARQNGKLQFMVRPVVKRYMDPETDTDLRDAETRLDELELNVENALFGWTMPGSTITLTWDSSVDGDPYEAVCIKDMVFNTGVTRVRNAQ